MLFDNCAWIVIDGNEEFSESAIDLIDQACLLSTMSGNEVGVLSIGHNEDYLKALNAYPVKQIVKVSSPFLDSYQPEIYVDAITRFCRQNSPKAMLFLRTLRGKEIASRLAARLKTVYIPDCIGIKHDSGNLVFIKSVYHEKVDIEITSCKATLPVLISGEINDNPVKPGKVEPIPVSVLTMDLSDCQPGTTIIGRQKGDYREIDIREAEVIVAGGRGVGNKENFKLIQELADALEGAVAGSLPAVDARWITTDRQVGQTGKVVKPKLYIACGISGSQYHLLGMKEAETVIAINTDRYAPIFKYADVKIIGDLTEIIPAILSQIKKEKEKRVSTTV